MLIMLPVLRAIDIRLIYIFIFFLALKLIKKNDSFFDFVPIHKGGVEVESFDPQPSVAIAQALGQKPSYS